jgi:hypothetical protein
MRITKGQLRKIIREVAYARGPLELHRSPRQSQSRTDALSDQVSLNTQMRQLLGYLNDARRTAAQIASASNDESAKGDEGAALASALMDVWRAFGADEDELFK